jgi:glyoxylase I family protein
MGLVEHQDNLGEPFDERRSGLDHISFAVATRDDIDHLVSRISSLGYGHPVVTDTTHATLLVLCDPDRIRVEVCCWKSLDAPL